MTAGASLHGPTSAAAPASPLPSVSESAGCDGTFGPVLLSFGVEPESADAASKSVGALRSALGALSYVPDLLLEAFPDLFDEVGGREEAQPGVGRGDILFTFGGRLSASRTPKFSILFKPSQRYLEMVAAIAADLKVDVITVHGWPILSVVEPSTTVSEAAGESISGGGAAK